MVKNVPLIHVHLTLIVVHLQTRLNVVKKTILVIWVTVGLHSQLARLIHVQKTRLVVMDMILTIMVRLNVVILKNLFVRLQGIVSQLLLLAQMINQEIVDPLV